MNSRITNRLVEPDSLIEAPEYFEEDVEELSELDKEQRLIDKYLDSL